MSVALSPISYVVTKEPDGLVKVPAWETVTVFPAATVTFPTVAEAKVTVELSEKMTLLLPTHADPPVDEVGFDQLVPVQVAELLSVRQYCCAFKFAITPSTTANKPAHFPSRKTEAASFKNRGVL